MVSPPKPKWRRHLRKRWSIPLALVLLKVVWVMLLREDGGALLRGETRDDIMARRAYLIQHVYERGKSTHDMPGYLSAQFKGEWALVTYSMFTAALTNIAVTYPETRPEARLIIKGLFSAPFSLIFVRLTWSGGAKIRSIRCRVHTDISGTSVISTG